MSRATLPQAAKILSLVAQQNVDSERLQKLIDSGLFSLLLCCENPEAVNESLFAAVLGNGPHPVAIYRELQHWLAKLMENRAVKMLDEYHKEMGYPPGHLDEHCLCPWCCPQDDEVGEYRWEKRNKTILRVLERHGVSPSQLSRCVETVNPEDGHICFRDGTHPHDVFLAAEAVLEPFESVQ